MGCVLQAVLGRTPRARRRFWRTAARSRRAHRQPGLWFRTARRVAGCAGIQTGDAEIVVAGGMESMTNAPYLLPQARAGYRMGNGALVDAMINDGLWDVYNNFHMGSAAEMVAAKYGIYARRAGRLRSGVASTRRRGSRPRAFPRRDSSGRDSVREEGRGPRRFDMDETVRPETTAEILAKLKPAFKEGGTVTAGNAPGVSDGAAALVVISAERARELVLAPMAIIRAQATSGRAPEWFSLAPIDAVRKVAGKSQDGRSRCRPI